MNCNEAQLHQHHSGRTGKMMTNTWEKETIHHQGTEDTINVSPSQNQKNLLCHNGDIKQWLAHSHTAVIGHDGQEVAGNGTEEGEEQETTNTVRAG